jgi:hypothetical protein
MKTDYETLYYLFNFLKIRSAKMFHKFKNGSEILGARSVTWNMFHIETPQILLATVQNLVATVICASLF